MDHNMQNNAKPRFEQNQKIETEDDDVSDDMMDTDEHMIVSSNAGATGGPKAKQRQQQIDRVPKEKKADP